MGRRPTRLPALEPHQRALARLIHKALDRGQRADKPESEWSSWTHAAFAATMKMTANAVANWRNQATPHPPDNIVPLLNTFYGDDPRYAEQREAMQKLWRQARGYVTDDPSPDTAVLTPTAPKSFQGPVQLVELRAHPVPANDGTVRLLATLVISPDDGVVFQDKAISIGLKDALLTLQSANWQPSHNAMIGEKQHDNFERSARVTKIIGPRDKFGRLDGLPLGEEPVAIIERLPDIGDGPVTLSILAPPRSFDVRHRADPDSSDPADREVSETKKIVLEALFQEQLTNHDERRAAVLVQVTLNPVEKIG